MKKAALIVATIAALGATAITAPAEARGRGLAAPESVSVSRRARSLPELMAPTGRDTGMAMARAITDPVMPTETATMAAVHVITIDIAIIKPEEPGEIRALSLPAV